MTSSFRIVGPGLFALRPITAAVNIANGELIIPTAAGGVIAKVYTPIDNSSTTVNFTINSDGKGMRVGDQLILLLQPLVVGGNSIVMSFPSNFFITQCGSQVTSINLEVLERWSIPFTWDGSAFVNTYDNC